MEEHPEYSQTHGLIPMEEENKINHQEFCYLRLSYVDENSLEKVQFIRELKISPSPVGK